MSIRDRLYAITVAVLWGINFLAIDLGLRQFPPLLFVGLRFVVLAIPTVLLVPWPKVKWYWLVGYGLGFGTLQFVFLFLALDAGMPTGLASLVLQASAPFTVLLGAAFLRERMTVRQVTGIAVAVLGMSLIFWHRSQVAAALPVVLTLLGGLGWAIGNVCSRQAQPESPLRLTMWMSVVPPLPMFAVSLLVEGPARDWHSLATINSPTGWSAIGALAYIVLPATILGSGLWTTLMRRNPAGVVAPFSLLVPVVGVGASWLLLHETPAWIELAAGVVVVFGVLLGIPKPAPKARRTPVLDEVVSAEV